MIRRGAFGDIPRLTQIVVENHARSVYATRSDVDLKLTKSLIMQAMQRDRLKTDGGTCVFVSERNGVVEGFIVGTLDRVYHIGTKLMAMDMFLLGSTKSTLREVGKLVDAYDAWAMSCPDVIEINLSATTVVGPTDRIEKLFARKGFVRSGAIFERSVS